MAMKIPKLQPTIQIASNILRCKNCSYSTSNHHNRRPRNFLRNQIYKTPYVDTLNVNLRSIGRNLSSSTSIRNEKEHCDQYRYNELNVQMLSKSLHQQIFGNDEKHTLSANLLGDIRKHLEKFNLWDKKTGILPDVDLHLPTLLGKDIEEHFWNLALEQTAIYRKHAEVLATNHLPPKPQKWVFAEGWTRYGRDGSVTAVDYPEEDGLVFDIEILVPDGNCPTMATAASNQAWYSWCSERLIEKRFYWSQNLCTRNLIPLETKKDEAEPPDGHWRQKLVIGHNVGFDRSFVKEQYYPKGSRTRFLDTMSLHIATNGLTTQQRMLFMAKKKGSQRKEVQQAMSSPFFDENPMDLEWIDKSSLNNLHDVHQLYTTQAPLRKETRNVFVTGTMEEIREDFQNLMAYCGSDVEATHAVFQSLWPEFNDRFPHPVTLGGMLEMSTAYMPVNRNWQRYIESSHAIFTALQHELKVTLMGLANSACELVHDKRYKEDVWMWDLDWSSKQLRSKKIKKSNITMAETAKERIQELMELAEDTLPSRPVHMPGYPIWYTELCPKMSELSQGVMAGPSLISTQKRVTPRLLHLTWRGFPLHYDAALGWGYIVPGRPLDELEKRNGELEDELSHQEEIEDGPSVFPLKSLYEICQPVLEREVQRAEVNEELRKQILERLECGEFDDKETGPALLWRQLAAAGMWKPKRRKKKRGTKLEAGPWFHEGDGPYSEVSIPGCWFFRLPHKDGPGNNTGNPLSKFHLANIETGELQANCGTNVDKVLQGHIMCSYWKNNEQRIRSQMVIRLRREELPEAIYSDPEYEEDVFFGALLPRVVTAGTVTRRAVESTWLTASNARADRIGSELKSMIQSPPGYKFVGADVDSQELWIAAILGDCNFGKIHGCTAFGWMTLLGNKAEKTDLHSRIAEQIGITREQAKVLLLEEFPMVKDDERCRCRCVFADTTGVVRGFCYKQGDKAPNFNEGDTVTLYNYNLEDERIIFHIDSIAQIVLQPMIVPQTFINRAEKMMFSPVTMGINIRDIQGVTPQEKITFSGRIQQIDGPMLKETNHGPSLLKEVTCADGTGRVYVGLWRYCAHLPFRVGQTILVKDARSRNNNYHREITVSINHPDEIEKVELT